MRRKAFKAATKKNVPLFGEDGKVRNMLEKYDDEEAEAGMQIDASGAIEDAKRQKQAAIRERLKAGESARACRLAAPTCLSTQHCRFASCYTMYLPQMQHA